MPTITKYYGLQAGQTIENVNTAIAKTEWVKEICEHGEHFIRVLICCADSTRHKFRFDIVIRESRLLLSVTPLLFEGGEIAMFDELKNLLISERVISRNIFDGFWD